jgi:uncharacterized membrane protein
MAAGEAHFMWPAAYERAVPDYLPAHRALVLASGLLELLGGVATLYPPTRRIAGWGLIALLLAVLPANIYMATHPALFDMAASLLFARLPLQFVLIGWIYWVLIRQHE